MARSLKFWVREEELYYPCSENKGADQLCSYCTADLRLFSHGQMSGVLKTRLILFLVTLIHLYCENIGANDDQTLALKINSQSFAV